LKNSKPKTTLVEFELRLFEGDRADKSQFICAVPFVLCGHKIRLPGNKTISSADANAVLIAQGLWAYLRYPSEDNQRAANVAMGALGGVDGLVAIAAEFSAITHSYGQLVRLPCPPLGLPGDRLHELLGVPTEELDAGLDVGPRWHTTEAQDMLKFVVPKR
jgi:hypothetical protein